VAAAEQQSSRAAEQQSSRAAEQQSSRAAEQQSSMRAATCVRQVTSHAMPCHAKQCFRNVLGMYCVLFCDNNLMISPTMPHNISMVVYSKL
jgi:hypothetical protein